MRIEIKECKYGFLRGRIMLPTHVCIYKHILDTFFFGISVADWVDKRLFCFLCENSTMVCYLDNELRRSYCALQLRLASKRRFIGALPMERKPLPQHR